MKIKDKQMDTKKKDIGSIFIFFFVLVSLLLLKDYPYLTHQKIPIPSIGFSMIPSGEIIAKFPEEPIIGSEIEVQIILKGMGVEIPGSNCTIDIYSEREQRVLEQKDFKPDKEGKINFTLKTNPTWLYVTCFNVTGDIRIPKATFFQNVKSYFFNFGEKISFFESWMWLILLILSCIYNRKRIFTLFKRKDPPNYIG